MEKLCENLKMLRNEKGLTQNDIAKILNITRTAYNMQENGLRLISLPQIMVLADFYNVSIDFLCGRVNY